jgi:hypothetical protein
MTWKQMQCKKIEQKTIGIKEVKSFKNVDGYMEKKQAMHAAFSTKLLKHMCTLIVQCNLH